MTWSRRLHEMGIYISIHMPHTWHDFDEKLGVLGLLHFNPHATYVA